METKRRIVYEDGDECGETGRIVNSEPKIVKCEIGPYPKSLFDEMPKVKATFDNGETKELFSFYPDEINFAEGEFIGKTAAEAVALKGKKDVAYLQSPSPCANGTIVRP